MTRWFRRKSPDRGWPLALLAGLIVSLLLHGVLLFGPEVAMFGNEPDLPAPLLAEIRPLPKAPVLRKSVPPPPSTAPVSRAQPVLPTLQEKRGEPELPREPEPAPEPQAPAPAADPLVVEPPTPVLASRGVIRYAIYKESLGLQIGRGEQTWEFTEDGRYRLSGMTETSGLAALLKSVRFEQESRGRLLAGGLQPERYRSWKNGQDVRENADFDWSTAVLHLERDGSEHVLQPGSQDVLSLIYQLAYLGRLADGSNVAVMTGKKYERYALDSLGEEMLETPLGPLRTLHLRATTESVTEIWIALDRQHLPVKIRFTDKKGDSYYQMVTEIGQFALPPA